MAVKKTTEQYNQELFEKEIDAWPLEEYINCMTPITHECIRGHTWKASPNNILKGTKCPLCVNKNLKKTTEQYKNELLNTGIIVLEPYINKSTPILHQCIKGHKYKARPNDVLQNKHGCTQCSQYGFKRNKPAILYYVKISNENETYYKIGITNKTVEERFKAEKDKTIKVLYVEPFELGSKAEEKEQEILKKFPSVNMRGFLRTGFSELFEYDILNKDKT